MQYSYIRPWEKYCIYIFVCTQMMLNFIDTKQFQFELCINRSCTKLICKFHVVKNDGSSTQEIPFGFHVFGEMFGLMHFCQKYIKFALIHYQIFNIVATKNGFFSFIDNEMIENIFILADQLTAHWYMTTSSCLIASPLLYLLSI